MMTRPEQSGEVRSLAEEAKRRIACAASGDRDAAQDILSALFPRIRNLVRYLVRSDRDVDDIAQDALVAILRGLKSFRHEGSIEAWSDRIVARVTFAHLRKRRAQPVLALVDSDGSQGGRTQFVSGDEYVARRRVVLALDLLPIEQRAAFVLHHVVEMSVAEVAVEVEAPVETVRSRIRLARDRLRQMGMELDPMSDSCFDAVGTK